MQPNTNTTVLEEPKIWGNINENIAYGVLEGAFYEQPKKYLRGIHLTQMIVNSTKLRNFALEFFNETEINMAVIDIKEADGQVYIPGVKMADENGAYSNIMPDIQQYLSKLKENDVYTVARIVVFKDNYMARKKPSMAVKNPDGTIWTDRKNIAWLDPYNKDAWDYILSIAERAADLGFEEIQFDYIRFPSDGNIKNCRYGNKNHSPDEASKAIVDFLKKANEVLKPKNVKISIDVFGLTTTSKDDMGIGQKIVEMSEWVDYVSPMVYPSHYAKGEYGIADPNKAPYEVVYKAMEGALKRIPLEKLRPWLQDFSWGGYKYGKDEVRAQIQACYDNDIGDWMLWNPRCVYTKEALKGNDAETSFEKSDPPTPEMLKTKERLEKEKNETEIKEAEIN
ncbi:MAG: putative glycoside hydrolase [Endomicrobia bacterium]|nr:putative glycoside hydrolase [Endomicrobiia bacterium]MCL2799418.1 putative glycoside hydrolase [Endomicrobiia bacterium]